MRDAAGGARTIAITGASGLIGRHLCDYFRRGGWNVWALMRDVTAYPFSERGIERFRLNLPDDVDVAGLRGADALVHAAYETRGGGGAAARRTNEDGAARIIDAARANGVRRLVFMSSLSAHADAISYYGRSKALIERRLDSARDLILRPGLVLAADGGLGLRMWRAVARLRVAPLFGGGGQIVQTVHIDDLCAAVRRAIELDLTGALNVAEPAGIPMRDLLTALAGAVHVRVIAVRLPTRATVALLRTLEALGVPLPLTSENLLGLVAMRHISTDADLRRLAPVVQVRPARESIADLAPLVGRE